MFPFSKVATAFLHDTQVSVSIEYSDSYLQKSRKSIKKPLYNVKVDKSTLIASVVSYPGMGLSFDDALQVFNEALVLEFPTNPPSVSDVNLPVFWTEGLVFDDTSHIPLDSAILTAVSGNLLDQSKLCAQVYPSRYDVLNFRDVLLAPRNLSNFPNLSLIGVFAAYGDDLHEILRTAASRLQLLGIVLDFIDIVRDQSDPNKFLLLSACTSLSIIQEESSGLSDPCYLFCNKFPAHLSLVGAHLNNASSLLGFYYEFETAMCLSGDDTFQLLCENGSIPKDVSVTFQCGNNSCYESITIVNNISECLHDISCLTEVATSPLLESL